MATKVTLLPAEDKPEILEEFAAHQRAVHHFIAHHEKLREQYPDQWIAVWVDEAAVPTVVDGDSVDSIVRKARRRSLPLKRSYIRYMETGPRYYA